MANTAKVSYSKIVEMLNSLNVMGDLKTPSNRLEYAASKLSRRLLALHKSYLEGREDIDIEFAATDDKGIILKEPNGEFKYSKEDIKKRFTALRALAETEVEVEPYLCKDQKLVDPLPLGIKELYNGVLFEWSEQDYLDRLENPTPTKTKKTPEL